MGDGFIGREHEFFDEAVSDVAFGSGDALHHAEFVKLDDRFRKIEIDRSAAFAFTIQIIARSRMRSKCSTWPVYLWRASGSASITAFTAV